MLSHHIDSIGDCALGIAVLLEPELTEIWALVLVLGSYQVAHGNSDDLSEWRNQRDWAVVAWIGRVACLLVHWAQNGASKQVWHPPKPSDRSHE